MATSAAERVRCSLCGKFLVRRPDWAGQDWEALERAYGSEAWLEQHDCAGLYSAEPVSAGQEARARATMSSGCDEMPRMVDVVDVDATELELVGQREVAVLLGYPYATVRQWRTRGQMPVPAMVSGSPVWTWATIEHWARRTGRLPGQDKAKVG